MIKSKNFGKNYKFNKKKDFYAFKNQGSQKEYDKNKGRAYTINFLKK